MLHGYFFMSSRIDDGRVMKRKNKYFHQDRIAMRIADRYGMVYDYKVARRHRMSPLEALEDWDLIRPEERALFERTR